VLLNIGLAQRRGGRFELRIENIDEVRCRPEYEEALLEDLAWLGVPFNAGTLRQSSRHAAYTDALDELARRRLVYRCFRETPDVVDAGSAPHRPRRRRYESAPLQVMEERDNLAGGRAFAWRLSLDAVGDELDVDELYSTEWTDDRFVRRPVHADSVADVVLGRRDTATSYHLASVVDDAAQGVTCVFRGSELAEAAGLHTVLHRLLGSPPPVFRHHALVTDTTGERLSKRRRSASLAGLRGRGVTADDIRAWVGGQRHGVHPALDGFRCSDRPAEGCCSDQSS